MFGSQVSTGPAELYGLPPDWAPSATPEEVAAFVPADRTHDPEAMTEDRITCLQGNENTMLLNFISTSTRGSIDRNYFS